MTAKASEFYCPLPITESLHKKDYKYGNIRRKSRTAEERVGRSYGDQRRNLFREYELTLRLLRIIRGEVFTLDDINKCRMEIMRQHPGYERPITAESGILLAAEAIRKSFGRKYYLPLYKYPILIDFGKPDEQICVIHPSNFISYTSKKEGEECELHPKSWT